MIPNVCSSSLLQKLLLESTVKNVFYRGRSCHEGVAIKVAVAVAVAMVIVVVVAKIEDDHLKERAFLLFFFLLSPLVPLFP